MIFSLLIVIIIIFRIFTIQIKNGKRLYNFIISFVLFIISGLRSMYVGTDSLSYVGAFYNSIFNFEYVALIDFIRGEFLYKLLVGFLRGINANYTILFIIIACFYSIVISGFVYRNSKEPTMSYLMLLSMGYFFFSMTGLRQTIAMCFVILAVERLLNNKTKSYFLLTFLATMFHQSALITLFIYILNKLKLNFKYVFGIVISSFLIYKYASAIIIYFVNKFWPTRSYEIGEYGGTSTLFLLIIIAISAFVIMKKSDLIEEKLLSTDSLYLKMVMFSIPIQVLAIFQANAFRASMYFHLVSIVLVPNSIFIVKNKIIKIIGYAFTILLLLAQFYYVTYYTAGIVPYSFFWEL